MTFLMENAMIEVQKKHNKLVLGLGLATGMVLLILLGFLVGSHYYRGGRDIPPPPPPPLPPVTEEVLREELKPGKTYRFTCGLGFNMRGKHKDFAVLNADLSIVYKASAVIDRTIVSNNGHTLVEDRFFRNVKSTALETTVERLNVDLGFGGDVVEGVAGLFVPDKMPFIVGGRKILEGANLVGLIRLGGWDQTLVKDLVERQEAVRLLTYGGGLEGKRARLTYENSNPPLVQVTALNGNQLGEGLTEDEDRFLRASVIPMNSLIFPDLNVKEGDRWKVPGTVFIGMLDPTLLATTDGEITLQRGKDRNYLGDKVAVVNVVGGQLEFKESTEKAASMGSFHAQGGELLFSFKDRIFVQGKLTGRGELTIHSKDHILFEARSNVQPELNIVFNCKILDNP